MSEASDHADNEWKLKVAGQLGGISSTLEAINSRLVGVETKIEHVSSTMNRWKGATAIIGLICGGLVTYVVKFFTGETGKV
jgi:hypothetical protein